MKVFLKNNFQFILMMVSWAAVGAYGGSVAAFIFIPLTLLLLRKKELYAELIIGFFFILIISDSRSASFLFAKNLKDVYIMMLGLFLFTDRKSFSPFNTFYQRFLLFFLVAFICMFYTETFYSSFERTVSYILLLMIVPNYVLKAYKDQGEAFLKNIVWFGVSILIIGLLLKIVDPAFVTLDNRFRGLLGNPDGLGIFTMMLFLLFVTVMEMHYDIFSRNDKILIYLAIIVSLLLSDSRSAIFSVILFYIFRYLYKMSSFLGFVLFVFILASYQLITNNIEPIIEGIGLQHFFRIKTFADASGRFIAWNFAWEHIRNNLFFGKGFNYTNYLYAENYNYLSRLGHQGNAHNSFLTFWLDTGLVGLVLYIRSLGLAFVEAAKKYRIAFPIMYTVLFSAFFESWLTASLNPFTIQLFIILTLLLANEFNDREKENTIPVL